MSVSKQSVVSSILAACCLVAINVSASSFNTNTKVFQVLVTTTIDSSKFPPEITGDKGGPLPTSFKVQGDAKNNKIITVPPVVLESRSQTNGQLVLSDWEFVVTDYVLGGGQEDPNNIDIYINGSEQSSLDGVSTLTLSVRSEGNVDLQIGQDIRILVDATASVPTL
jgi:hypothetical protein